MNTEQNQPHYQWQEAEDKDPWWEEEDYQEDLCEGDHQYHQEFWEAEHLKQEDQWKSRDQDNYRFMQEYEEREEYIQNIQDQQNAEEFQEYVDYLQKHPDEMDQGLVNQEQYDLYLQEERHQQQRRNLVNMMPLLHL